MDAVFGQMVLNALKDCGVVIFKEEMEHYNPLKHQKLLAQLGSIISQKFKSSTASL
jgi:hypothetical protein